MTSNSDIQIRASAVIAALAAAGKTVTTAESCTGGWIAKALTDISGSSACFAYGIVSYSNGAKESLLGVANQTLVEHGAVSQPTVGEMASGAMNLSGADIAVAVSGVAGPGGGSDEKPVGTVCFAWAVRGSGKIDVYTDQQHFSGDRDSVRSQTVDFALAGIQERLHK
jgi:nicotinamide-nucleotide amidase